MIDLHSHILPQIDDGSKSVEETTALLKMLAAQGVTTLAATPHFYPKIEAPEAFLQRREQALAQLPRDTDIKILPGAEVAYFAGIGSSDVLPELKIGNTKLLLVEMPFTPWTDRMVQDICNIPMQQGLLPVLAHVNRYLGLNQFPRFMETLAEAGVLFQCNAEAFLTMKGRLWAMRLLKAGHVHFLGSDCHNLDKRPPTLDIACQRIEKKLGKAFLSQLHKNAEVLLNQ